MIAQITGSTHNGWDDWLTEITLSMNSSRSESTGYSLAYQLNGWEIRLSKSLNEITSSSGTIEETAEDRWKRMKETGELERKNIEKAAQDEARAYNLRKRDSKRERPKLGDLVRERPHPLSIEAAGLASKLAPNM